MIRRPPRSTQSRSSAASDVYKRQGVVHTRPPPQPYLELNRELAGASGFDPGGLEPLEFLFARRPRLRVSSRPYSTADSPPAADLPPAAALPPGATSGVVPLPPVLGA